MVNRIYIYIYIYFKQLSTSIFVKSILDELDSNLIEA